MTTTASPGLLIAIAALGLVLGVIALIVAFNAKSASDDAASQQSVDRVQTELSNLVDKLGIAESTLSGEQQNLQGKARTGPRSSPRTPRPTSPTASTGWRSRPRR